MVRIFRALAIAFTTLAAPMARGATLPAPTVEYSADRVIESEMGNFEGKVYSAKDKERIEMAMKGMSTVTITRRDKQLGWMLMPSHRMYQTLDLARAQKQSGGAPGDEVQIDIVAQETVEGFASTKYKMLMKDGSAGGFIWITEQGIAVKMDMLSKSEGKKTRITMTLKNLKIGPRDASVFELPSGYSPMPSMAGMNGFGTR